MAVVAMWKCDRDGSMFENKKEADTYDKMLELGEHFSAFLEKHVEGLSEQDAENIGLLLARNKDQLITACKGKPKVLLEIGSESGSENSTKEDAAEASQSDSNITTLAANA